MDNPPMTPDVQHFQDCDDLALGRLVRSRGSISSPVATLQAIESLAVAMGVEVPFRQGCDCARLRASAVATQQERIRKASAAVRGGR